MTFSVDRIEGQSAVLQNDAGETRIVALSQLPPDVREGAVLVLLEGKYLADAKKEVERKRRLHALMNRMFGR